MGTKTIIRHSMFVLNIRTQTQETIMLVIVRWNVATVRQRKYVMNMMTYTTNIARR
jgi:hypothetical protein